MIHKIETIEHVKTFFLQLLAEDLNFHPDTLFKDYISVQSEKPTYSEEEAELRNQLLEQSFTVCERDSVDIYDLGIEVFRPFSSK